MKKKSRIFGKYNSKFYKRQIWYSWGMHINGNKFRNCFSLMLHLNQMNSLWSNEHS